MDATEASPIGALSPGDAAAAVALSAEAGWNQVEADWRFMLEAGTGFAAREPDGAPCGSALILPLGKRLAWIGMVLVTARRRRLGLGTALLRRCLDGCAARGMAAGLDATELGRPVYGPLGFEDVFALRRWRFERRIASAPFARGVALAPAAGGLDTIAAFDAARSGMERGAVLAHLLGRGPALVARDESGALLGYALSRDGRTARHIGPVVADDEAAALALVSAMTERLAPPLLIDVPEAQRALAALLRASGADDRRGFTRMVRGDAPGLADTRALFAIAGPELG